ncbi:MULTISPECIES: hypothetical protein [unclassified Nonomuraea]
MSIRVIGATIVAATAIAGGLAVFGGASMASEFRPAPTPGPGSDNRTMSDSDANSTSTTSSQSAPRKSRSRNQSKSVSCSNGSCTVKLSGAPVNSADLIATSDTSVSDLGRAALGVSDFMSDGVAVEVEGQEKGLRMGEPVTIGDWTMTLERVNPRRYEAQLVATYKAPNTGR